MREITLQDLINIASYLKPKEKDVLSRAYKFAASAHKGQRRNTGEDYLQHPLRTAYELAKLHLDLTTLVAALLHDACEDTSCSTAQLRRKFGRGVAAMVDGVTKIGQIRLRTGLIRFETKKLVGFEQQMESLRKMILAMSRDVRVVLIKLFDRLHNMRTIKGIKREKRKRFALETLEIYAPLAQRLGMGELKGQLEDLAFPYVCPQGYRWVNNLINLQMKERKKYIQKVMKSTSRLLRKNHIELADIHGRAKHLYSLYRKLLRYDRDISKIYDLVALRIIVKTIPQCYQVLGVIHKTWRPLIGRIKDFIALPKPNGYQSLHTTVFALEGKLVEMQIRSIAIHEQAEYGVAAHWHYKTTLEKNHGVDRRNLPIPKKDLVWIKELATWQKKLKNVQELSDALRVDFFKDRIFVYTPKGDIKELPAGSTPIDFAYEVHTEIGNKCVGAKVNGRIRPLSSTLQNGDVVEIMINRKSKGPKRDWLNFVKSNHARQVIKKRGRKISKTH